MKHYLGRVALAMAALFLLSVKFVDVTIGAGFGQHPAETAWAATGLTAQEFAINYWLTTQNKAPEQDLRRLAERLGARFGAAHSSVFAGRARGVSFANLDGEADGGGEFMLTVQQETAFTHFGASCCYDGLPPDTAGLARRLRSTLAGMGSGGELSWSIRGSQSGRLSDSAWRALWARVLTAVKAVRRGEDEGDDLIRAYSPLLPSEPGRTESAINLVLKRQYDAGSKCTLVVMSSPDAVPDI